jgi:hypothetical protein
MYIFKSVKFIGELPEDKNTKKKLRAAKRYLGTKYVFHPTRHIQKKPLSIKEKAMPYLLYR